MIFFALYGVLRGFPAATYTEYASPQTLVRPCPTQKIRIYGLETLDCYSLIVAGNICTQYWFWQNLNQKYISFIDGI